jgi:PAS domain S-box-containing protein
MTSPDLEAGDARDDERLPTLVCEIDGAGRLLRAGRAVGAWFGAAAAVLADGNLAERLPQDARGIFDRARAPAGGRVEATLDTAHGRRVADIRVEPHPDSDHATVLFEDLTGLRRAQRRAATVTAQFEQAFGASAAGLGIVAPDGRWLRANAALCDMLGYREEELLGMRFQDVTHPEDLAADLEQNDGLFAGVRESFSMHKRYLHRNGRVLHVHLAVALVRGDDGRPRHSIAQIIDMTPRVETEAQLREREVLFRAMTESSPVGIFVDSRMGECVYVNPAYLRIVGLSRDEALGTGWKKAVHPADRALLEASFAAREQTGGVGRVEHRFLHPDGRVVQTRVTTVELVDEGRSHGFLGVVEDITEARAAAEEIQTLNAELGLRVAHRTLELEAAVRDLESFAYSVSHDLKAPLRAIDGYSALLAEMPLPDDEAGTLLGAIRATTGRMARLIDDLLALSSVGRRDLRRHEIDLAAVARAVAAELATGRPDSRVRVVIAPTLPAYGDPHLLRVLLQNLLDNAWKFSGRRPDPEIEVGTYEEAGRRVYFVRDNGVGFDAAYADKLFQPFQRLHRAEDFPGSGIGLASAQRIVERHGGRIWGTTATDGGAVFAFTLSPGPAA